MIEFRDNRVFAAERLTPHVIGTTAALIGMGLAAAGSAGASMYGASKASGAAKDAAQAQQDATRYAADLQKQSSDQALQFQKDIWTQQQEQQKPWLEAGKTALGTLASGVAPGGDLVKPFDPKTVDLSTDDGYNFRVAEGMKQIERSAAARGGVTGGGTLKALTRYAQGAASDEYQRAYDRSFNSYQVGQGNNFNRLAALAGVGQTATNQLAQEGTAAAGGVSNNLLNTGANLANLATQTGNAQASGYVGSANAWNQGMQGVSGALNSIPNYLLLMQMLNKQPVAAVAP